MGWDTLGGMSGFGMNEAFQISTKICGLSSKHDSKMRADVSNVACDHLKR